MTTRDGCPPPITVRNMIQGDSDFAGRMTVEAFESKFVWAVGKNKIPNVLQLEQQTHQQITDKYGRIFVALYEGQPAGLVALTFHGQKGFSDGIDVTPTGIGCWGLFMLQWLEKVLGDDDIPTGHCYIDHIAVDAQYRGRGIGKVLMETAEVEARKSNCHSMLLWVARENRARHLYERQGYRVTEEEDGCLLTYIPSGIRHWCKMVKRL